MFNFFNKSDSEIQRDVLTELKWDPSLRADLIQVMANDGIVTLTGSVPHYFEKSIAESAAQRVGGVKAVADELEVKLSDEYLRSDEAIARDAIAALAFDYQTPKDLKISVEKGWVTIKGEVEWNYQRNAAGTTIKSLNGVNGITNEITLKKRVEQSDVKKAIEEALKRSAESEGRKITVSVNGSSVTLSGTVHSYNESEDARLAAWNAPGVTLVENNIRLSA